MKIWNNEPIGDRLDYAKRHAKRKYSGDNQCGPCQVYSHRTCRPRLDGSLCGCNCPRAVEFQTEVRDLRENRRLMGQPEPADRDALIELNLLRVK